MSRGRPGFDSPTGRPGSLLPPNGSSKSFWCSRRSQKEFRFDPEEMRWPGIEPGSTAWKAAMLTTIPPTQAADVGFGGQKRTLEAHEPAIGGQRSRKPSFFGPVVHERALPFHAE
ncbi:hypothetical protein ROHU_003401 [Labeo rohita]|uniref:Uncharacterized protein n=1 Tax=Labeo rohita TaxID=84645 RepID=A0A498NVC2_LABRO|nr:hypothetical protein ROHU_003401 [Labeo rohita]